MKAPRTNGQFGSSRRHRSWIETAEQLARLRAIDCRLGQGFYFSPALPGDEVLELLDRAWPSSLTA